jgi:hypothetical protein
MYFQIVNLSTVDTITLRHENASSTAANRIIGPGSTNLVIAIEGSAELWYDTTTARWRARP